VLPLLQLVGLAWRPAVLTWPLLLLQDTRQYQQHQQAAAPVLQVPQLLPSLTWLWPLE
jgi:hypothetical protein